MPRSSSCTVIGTGGGDSQNHESRPTRPIGLGFAATPAVEVHTGMGGGESGPAHAMRCGDAFCTLSNAMTWTHAVSREVIPTWARVRGPGLDAACNLAGEPFSVSHDVKWSKPDAKKSRP